MNCIELEREWDARELRLGGVSQTQPWSAAAEQHFADCLQCRRKRAADEFLDRALAELQAQPIPLVTTDRLVAAIVADERSRSLPRSLPAALAGYDREGLARRGMTAPAIAAAAVALAALAVGLFLQPQHRHPQMANRRATASANLDNAISSSAPVTDTMAHLWGDVRTRSQAAARTTVASLEQLPRLPIPSVTRAAIPIDMPATSADDETRWPDIGGPLGRRVSSALRFLGDALPAESTPAS